MVEVGWLTAPGRKSHPAARPRPSLLLLIVMNDADGLHIFDGIVKRSEAKRFFRTLSCQLPKPVFLRPFLPVLQRGVLLPGPRFHDGVDLLLRKSGHNRLRFFGLRTSTRAF